MDEVIRYKEYEIRTFYAGMSGYSITKDGVEVYNGFSTDEVIDRFGFNPYEVIWNARHGNKSGND